MKKIIFLILLFMLFSSVLSAQEIYHVQITGIINPVIAQHLSDSLQKAQREGVQAVIIQLDTPGGLMQSMHQMVKDILNFPKPVIVWVGPSGARAASAGVFITMASDIAAMAPGTSIGAAHPVQISSGSDIAKMSDIMEKKITNDAAAYIKSITSDKKRNWQWAQKAVTESLSLPGEEAVEQNVVEYLSESIPELLQRIDGKTITKKGKEFTVNTKHYKLISVEMTWVRKFLNAIAHPNLSYIFMILGVYGLIFELRTPGVGFGAIVGGICLILAFLSFQVFPINIAGVLLILFGIGLIFLDIITPSYGILTAGGAVSFVLGSLILFKSPQGVIKVSISVILTIVVFSVLFSLFALGSGLKIQGKKVTTGKQGLIGLRGKAISLIDLEGQVYVHGEIWKAESDEKIEKDEYVQILSVNGNRIKVKRADKKQD